MNAETVAAIAFLREHPATEPGLGYVLCLLLAECVETLDSILNP